VDTLVIPVRLSGTWLIYMTERLSRTQTVMRIADGFQRADDEPTVQAMSQLDNLVYTVGRGAMDIWLRMLLRDINR
jgi:hypothetical protein